MFNVEPKCFEVVDGVHDAIKSVVPENPEYFVVGGVAGSAYESRRTIFDHSDTTIYAAGDHDKHTIRSGGSRRDIDVIFDGVLDEEVSRTVKEGVTDAVSGALEVSIFDYNKHRSALNLGRRLVRGLFSGVSQRSIDENGQHYYTMFPVEQPVKAGSYKPWRLVTPNGYELNVLHPVGHLMSYDIRSIGGPRPKNAEKNERAWQTVNANFDVGELTDEGGLFHEWQLFADATKLLREGKMTKDHPALQADSGAVSMWFHKLKSKPVGWVEAQPELVDFFLKGPMQKALNTFTRSK